MFVFQSVLIVAVAMLYCSLVFLFCRKFTRLAELPVILILPVISFSAGFILRLSGYLPLVDIGYFFTESSTVFLYALFTGALILGQLKFWRK